MPESARGRSDETHDVGRHERPRSGRERWTAVLAGAAVMGVVLAGVAWVLVSALVGDDPPATSPGTTTTSSAPALAQAQRTLSACQAHVAAQEELAQAASDSARDWRTHTLAQLRLDSGDWTVKQAQAAWDSSMERGNSDVKQFTDATRELRSGPGSAACRSVVAQTASTDLADEGKSCAERDKALASVASAGTVVNSKWAEHLVMMANKPHADAADYRDRWVAMVEQSQDHLRRYEAAAEALKSAPSCED
jgi:hypothetical protein